MDRLRCCFVGCLSFLVFSGFAGAASEQATRLRSSNGLSPYTPADSFLNANFVADETEPAYVFGKVEDFVKSRSCPTAWLMEEGEIKRVTAKEQPSGPIEYSLYLEEDCPGRVIHYVFVDRSRANSAQWMEWRKQFHKSKTDPQYGAAKAVLEEATRNGFAVGAELRFVTENGELVLKKPEEALTSELKAQPVYDLKQGRPITP
ncbi:MAG: hypothetical protein AB9873_06760 [Syntrophobacteraceae bacterium]